MLKVMSVIGAVLSALLCVGCAQTSAPVKKEDGANAFVQVKGTTFSRNGKPYYIAGANMWYAGYLGAPTNIGDRARLVKELDTLKGLGINNLRVLAVSEKSELNSAVKPATTNGFGNYDENLLIGLDYLLVELAKRDMTVVLYFNNFWQWSGGMTQYLNWIDHQPVQDPNVTNDYEAFMAKSAKFYQSQKAQQEYKKTIEKIVKRVNTLNGKPYFNDATIMSWQLANEPRPGNSSTTDQEKTIYVNWINDTASFIHQLDANHLVSTGSEGFRGSADDPKLFAKAHALPSIDYLTYHLWIRNWGWIDQHKMAATYDAGLAKGKAYLHAHIDAAKQLNKPIVLEEFGLDRDGGSYDIKATTQYRDRYYREVFDILTTRARAGDPIAGFNFWAWNGSGRTTRSNYWWQEGDDLMGDPPQEQQGMYGVFDSDVSTIEIIREYSAKLNAL